MEEWRDVVGYEERYEVSSYGQVRSKAYLKHTNNGGGSFSFITTPRLMKQTPNRSGYLTIDLRKDKKRATGLVHRLVGKAFMDNPNNLPVINHLDSVRTNNYLSNLEWASYQRNVQHSYDCGSNSNKGELHPRRLLCDDIVRCMRADKLSGVRVRDIAHKYGFREDTTGKAISGKNWGHVK